MTTTSSISSRIPVGFIGGAFRGPTWWVVANNVRKAEYFGLEVAKMGAMPIIPQANTHLFYGQLSEELFWLPGTTELLRRSDFLVLIPGWRASVGATAERDAFCSWGRGDQIFYLDGFPVEKISENDDYARLQAWIASYADDGARAAADR